jgi:hypothetical protein
MPASNQVANALAGMANETDQTSENGLAGERKRSVAAKSGLTPRFGSATLPLWLPLTPPNRRPSLD